MKIEMKKTLHEGKKSFHCGMCDNTYSTKGNLTRHVDKIHGKNESDRKSKAKKEHASISDNDKLEKNPVTTIKEVIFCQEILEQYCYKIEHIPILDLKKCEFNQKKEETNNTKTITKKRKFIKQSVDSSNKTEELSKNDSAIRMTKINQKSIDDKGEPDSLSKLPARVCEPEQIVKKAKVESSVIAKGELISKGHIAQV